MPTILTHPAVPIATGLALGHETIPPRLMIAGVAVSILPDLDVLAFRLGVPYTAQFGHRGFSHSILFAACAALLGACLRKRLTTSFRCSFLFLMVCAVSHGVLDAFTGGGMGVAFWWPWSDERFFFPVRMIKVAPLGLSRFLKPDGLSVLCSELLWVWLPLLACAGVFAGVRTKWPLNRS